MGAEWLQFLKLIVQLLSQFIEMIGGTGDTLHIACIAR
jgi:hypothetical protein